MEKIKRISTTTYIIIGILVILLSGLMADILYWTIIKRMYARIASWTYHMINGTYILNNLAISIQMIGLIIAFLPLIKKKENN